MDLVEVLEKHADRHPNRLAMIFDNRAYSFRELNEFANKIANSLISMGVKKGDRVSVCLPNCPEHIFVHYGVLKSGALLVPLNVMYRGREVGHILKDSGVKVLFVSGSLIKNFQEVLPEISSLKKIVEVGGIKSKDRISFGEILTASSASPQVELDERDEAFVLYTSGTTGKSKGAIITHSNVLACANAFTKFIDWNESDRPCLALPVFHAFAIYAMHEGMVAGSTLVLMDRFSAEKVLAAIEKYRCTIFEGVPTMFYAFLDLPNAGDYNLKSLRVCVTGGASIPPSKLQDLKDKLGMDMLEGYGLTESQGIIFNPFRGKRKIGSVGVPMIGEARVVDKDDKDVPVGEVGEIVLRNPVVMKGYWGMPEATAEAMRGGWLHTGDLARQDEDRYFYIVDRKKDMINVSGFKVFSRELEDVLYAHPKIQDVAVIGIPHPYKGEAVKAIVVLKDKQKATPEEIIDYCRRNLAAYKVPSEVEFIAEMPKTATGKISKVELRSFETGKKVG